MNAAKCLAAFKAFSVVVRLTIKLALSFRIDGGGGIIPQFFEMAIARANAQLPGITAAAASSDGDAEERR